MNEKRARVGAAQSYKLFQAGEKQRIIGDVKICRVIAVLYESSFMFIDFESELKERF